MDDSKSPRAGKRFAGADADPKMMLEMYRMLKKLSGLPKPTPCSQNRTSSLSIKNASRFAAADADPKMMLEMYRMLKKLSGSEWST